MIPKRGTKHLLVQVDERVAVDVVSIMVHDEGHATLRRPFRGDACERLEDGAWQERWNALHAEGFVEDHVAVATGALPDGWYPPMSREDAIAAAREVLQREGSPDLELSGLQRFEARRTNVGWSWATGRSIRPVGKRAKGLERRAGWWVCFLLPERPREPYRRGVPIYVFDDGEASLDAPC